MLTFLTILKRAILFVAAMLAGDSIVSFMLYSLKLAFAETFGDLILVEVAIFFILAGVIDFASSVGVTQFRKSYLGREQGYSPSEHKESERRASVFLVAGLILFFLLILAVICQRL